MRRSRLGALGALSAVIMVAVTTGVAPAASPSATGSQAFVSGSPAAIACGGSVDARVTVNGQAGTTGAATDVMLVLDLSGSTGTPPSKLADLKRAATDALDRARRGRRGDRPVDRRQRARASSTTGARRATIRRPARLELRHARAAVINGLPAPAGGSPHGAGISTASAALAASASGYAKAMVLISDGQDDGARLTSGDERRDGRQGERRSASSPSASARTRARRTSQSWASQSRLLPVRHARPDQQDEAARRSRRGRRDAGRASRSPRRSARTSPRPRSARATGTVATSAGSLEWTGTLDGSADAPRSSTARRATAANVFAPTNELVSTMSARRQPAAPRP